MIWQVFLIALLEDCHALAFVQSYIIIDTRKHTYTNCASSSTLISIRPF